MVLLTTTPQILSVLSTLPPSTLSTLSSTRLKTTAISASSAASNSQSDADHFPLPTSPGAPISHHTLIAISRLRLSPLEHADKHDDRKSTSIPSLNTLLRGTKPYVAPPPPKPAPSPEYVALMARLRAEQEARDYAALLAQRRQTDPASLLRDLEERDPLSPSLVFNILLSVVMCAVAVFHVTRWWANDGVRVLVSLGAGLVVGIAEVGVYSIYLHRVAEARAKEKAKKEVKIVMGELGSSAGTEKQGDNVKVMVAEREAIWGKGIHGGMRRRVREKWEKEQVKNEE